MRQPYREALWGTLNFPGNTVARVGHQANYQLAGVRIFNMRFLWVTYLCKAEYSVVIVIDKNQVSPKSMWKVNEVGGV